MLDPFAPHLRDSKGCARLDCSAIFVASYLAHCPGLKTPASFCRSYIYFIILSLSWSFFFSFGPAGSDTSPGTNDTTLSAPALLAGTLACGGVLGTDLGISFLMVLVAVALCVSRMLSHKDATGS